MPKPEDLLVDDLQAGQRITFAPQTVGIRHADFGMIDGQAAFVERVGDTLVAETSDGRRFEVGSRLVDSTQGYSLYRLGE